jgi:hypothetical protein
MSADFSDGSTLKTEWAEAGTVITAIAMANKDLRITEKNVRDSICICFSLLLCMEAIMLSYGINILLYYSNRKQAYG